MLLALVIWSMPVLLKFELSADGLRNFYIEAAENLCSLAFTPFMSFCIFPEE
jgi:hypothetical protein